MGCDIHMHYEIKQDGEWKFYDWRSEFRQGEYSDGSTKYDYDKLFDHPLYIHRNYNLFAVLANVRNGYGFAGYKTGEGFEPVSMPRGLPQDVTSEVKAESDSLGVDGHSHSWLSLSELMAYDWEKTVIQHGVVSPEEYKSFAENGKPNSWCSGAGGQKVEHISESAMKMIADGSFKPKEDVHYYTSVSWKESYRASIGNSWFAVMKFLDEHFGADNVRLVFWFDN